MAASSGHGRVSLPENFTTRAASHRLITLVITAITAAAGGIASARKAISRCGLLTPGTVSGALAVPPVSICNRWVRARVRLARKLVASRPKLGMATTTTRAASTAAQATSRPGGYHSSVGAAPLPPTGRASMAR